MTWGLALRAPRISAGLVTLLAGATAAVVSALAAAGCSDRSVSPDSLVVLNAELERLNAYDLTDGIAKQTVISGNEDESNPDLPAVNGQICFLPDGSRRFIIGDDAGQPAIPPGWALIQLTGNRVGELGAQRLLRFQPTYQPSPDGTETIGCGFLPDGRLLTTDVGNQVEGPGNGQLVLWFPPLDVENASYCKLDVTLGTAGEIFIDDQERIYVTSARDQPGVYRYSGPYPTSADAEGGCGRRDVTGAPLADGVSRELFIRSDMHVQTPTGVVGTPAGSFYVASILNGVIAEYDAGGRFVRVVLEPPSTEVLGPEPFSTGTPFGIALDSSGTLYYADLGIVIRNGDIGPGPRTGSVRRIRFENGIPLPPETIDSGLGFPDGFAILEGVLAE
jgi:hypothetical protein